MSIERLDNTKGYTKSNTVLIAVEFNGTDTTAIRKHAGTGSAQWSKEKVALLMDTINKQKPRPSNFQEWRAMIDAMTFETHDPELFRMRFPQNKQKPTNFQELKVMLDAMTLKTHDHELFCMRFKNNQKPVPTNFREWKATLNVMTLKTHDHELFCMKF